MAILCLCAAIVGTGAFKTVNMILFILLIVFLIFNQRDAKYFMGDAGSMLIGFAIAWLLIDLSQGEDRVFAPVTALWLFALPLIEMVTVVLRRFTSGKSPFKPDSFHSHHLLIRLGFGEKTTLLVIILFSLLMAVIGILGELYGVAEWVMFVAFLLIFGIHFFSYRMFFRKI